MLLPVGAFSAELSGGVSRPWNGQLNAFVRGELDWHPRDNLAAFAFAQADLVGVQAGLGLKVAL